MNLSRIKTRIRAATGWTNEDLYDVTLTEKINWVYARVIPSKLAWERQKAWVYVPMASGDSGDYPWDTKIYNAATAGSIIGTRVINIYEPALLLIDDDTTTPINLTYDHREFWRTYPPYTNENDGQPAILLIDGRTVFARPKPDDTYTLQLWASLLPADLSDGSDEPVEDWSEAIIAGTVATILEDDEEDALAESWWAKMRAKLSIETSLDRKQHTQRIKPRF
jgi:hypothetical protein